MSIWQKAVRFIGFSGLGWILDFIVYTILGIWFSNLVVNNFISSWVGVTFVFIFATRKVFENSSKVPLWAKYLIYSSKVPLWAKYLIYIVYQFVLILCVSKLLGVIDVFIQDHFTWELLLKTSKFIAKILITPITMTLNFFVMRGVVEKL